MGHVDHLHREDQDVVRLEEAEVSEKAKPNQKVPGAWFPSNSDNPNFEDIEHSLSPSMRLQTSHMSPTMDLDSISCLMIDPMMINRSFVQIITYLVRK